MHQLTELVCSPIKKLHDLSLNRCETGWILSLELCDFSTKGINHDNYCMSPFLSFYSVILFLPLLFLILAQILLLALPFMPDNRLKLELILLLLCLIRILSHPLLFFFIYSICILLYVFYILLSNIYLTGGDFIVLESLAYLYFDASGHFLFIDGATGGGAARDNSQPLALPGAHPSPSSSGVLEPVPPKSVPPHTDLIGLSDDYLQCLVKAKGTGIDTALYFEYANTLPDTIRSDDKSYESVIDTTELQTIIAHLREIEDHFYPYIRGSKRFSTPEEGVALQLYLDTYNIFTTKVSAIIDREPSPSDSPSTPEWNRFFYELYPPFK